MVQFDTLLWSSDVGVFVGMLSLQAWLGSGYDSDSLSFITQYVAILFEYCDNVM